MEGDEMSVDGSSRNEEKDSFGASGTAVDSTTQGTHENHEASSNIGEFSLDPEDDFLAVHGSDHDFWSSKTSTTCQPTIFSQGVRFHYGEFFLHCFLKFIHLILVKRPVCKYYPF
jgi:hypothetical protein